MANTLGGLSKQLRQLAIDIPLRANAAKQAAARTINFDLLQTTPVDTGAAVSNWIVNLDEAATEIREPFVGSPPGSLKQTDKVRTWTHKRDTEETRQANVQEAIAVANTTIDQAQPGQPIHITNNLPYIQALDEGHSSQAVNFVSRAIILGEDTVARVTLTR